MKLKLVKLSFCLLILVAAFLAQGGDAYASCTYLSDYNNCLIAVAADNVQCLGSAADQYFCHAIASDKICRCYQEFCDPLGICVQGPID